MQPIPVAGPYRQQPTRRQLAVSLIVNAFGLATIGGLLALSVFGAAGWL